MLLIVLLLVPAMSRADSERIRAEFFDRLKAEKNFGAYDLDVDVRRGIFTATGSVASEVSRARIDEIAETIAGVDTVANRVVVSGMVPRLLAPVAGSIGEKILAQVKIEVTRENYALQIAEDDTKVTLIGTVDTTEGSRKIGRIAADLAMGKKVINQIVVREEALTDEQLRARVLAALNREPLINTNDLKIAASRGVIEIAGERSNHRDIDRILSVIVMVDGVKDVRSSMRLVP